MNARPPSQRRAALQILASVMTVLTLAFAYATNAQDSGRMERKDNVERSKSGSCTTAEEFKAIITHNVTYLARNYEKRQVVFHSFKVGAPQSYKNFQEGYTTVTNAAYPVLTSFDVITTGDEMGTSRVYRDRYKEALFMCYPVTSKNTCVCFGEKNSRPVVVREEVTGNR